MTNIKINIDDNYENKRLSKKLLTMVHAKSARPAVEVAKAYLATDCDLSSLHYSLRSQRDELPFIDGLLFSYLQ